MSQDDPIYLDHNATTPLLPEVFDAMLPYLREHFGNPSSGHIYGQRTKQALERARGQVAALLGCHDDEVIFTSGGTEANNLAIRGVMEALAQPNARVITSVIEHPATARPCAWLERQGASLVRLGVDEHGCVRAADAQAALAQGAALVTLMHANNETGSLQPVEVIARMAREAGAVVHTDAAQSVGKVPTSVDALGVDLLSIAGHKLYAPKGVGALYVRRGVRLAPLMRGADHELGRRPGTESLASIVALGQACALAQRDLDHEAARQQRLRDALWAILAAQIPGLSLSGHPLRRLPNTLHVRFPDASGDAVLAGAPQVAASTGSACHAGHATASAVITAMGVPERQALGAVRLTLGRMTREEDVELAAWALIRAWRGVTASP